MIKMIGKHIFSKMYCKGFFETKTFTICGTKRKRYFFHKSMYILASDVDSC